MSIIQERTNEVNGLIAKARDYTTQELRDAIRMKRKFKRGDVGYSDAVPFLMFEYGMSAGEAREYLDS